MRTLLVLSLLTPSCSDDEPAPDGDSDTDTDTDTDVDADTDTDSDSDTDVPCDGDDECDDPTPICDDVCVACRDEGVGPDPGCADPLPYCDEMTRSCWQCRDDDDCPDLVGPVCDEATHACVACSVNEDCAHIGANICDDGVCVECTPQEEALCDGMSCDPATDTCTETPLASVDICEPCVADSECMADHLCIPTEFQGAAHGAFCLKGFATGCERPFTFTVHAASLSGALAGDYCGVDPAVTTCDAVRHRVDLTPCDADEDCGAEALDDGICLGTCTYACADDEQCPEGSSCAGDPTTCGD